MVTDQAARHGGNRADVVPRPTGSALTSPRARAGAVLGVLSRRGGLPRYVAGRLLLSLVLLAGSSLLVFGSLRLLPGDPVTSRLGTSAAVSAETVELMRAEMGLDRPFLVQYGSWIWGVLRGDFGESFSSRTPVTTLIGEALPVTLQLTAVAMVLVVLLSVPLGVLSAVRQGGVLDRLLTAVTTAGMSLPPFLLGIALITVFSVTLGWLPARGYVPLTESLVDNAVHLVLPTTTLAFVASPPLIRFIRSSMLEVLQAPFIRTARGKGLSWAQVIRGHALRNALVPALTMLGLIVGYTLGGVVVIEYVFGFTGLGSLAVRAVSTRDIPVLQGVTLLISAMFIITTFLVDLAYGAVDPRLRAGRGAGS